MGDPLGRDLRPFLCLVLDLIFLIFNILMYVGVYEGIQSYLEVYKAIWWYMKVYKNIWTHLFDIVVFQLLAGQLFSTFCFFIFVGGALGYIYMAPLGYIHIY